jgi:hypothetical protein
VRALLLPTVAALVCSAGTAGQGLAASGETEDCIPLSALSQVLYRNADDAGVRLLLGDCTFELTKRGAHVRGGSYTVTLGGGSNGRLLLSHDAGCTGEQNYPTSYNYSFIYGGAVLVLRLADSTDVCEGRESDLAGSPFLRVISGKVRIVYTGTWARGTFQATGALTDTGTYALSRVRRIGSIRRKTLRLTGAKGAILVTETISGRRRKRFVVEAGAAGYLDLRGRGAERGPVRLKHLRVTLTGRVANI